MDVLNFKGHFPPVNYWSEVLFESSCLVYFVRFVGPTEKVLYEIN